MSKEEQIEALKSFAQKFKVPYDVPNDMGNVLRKTNNVPLKDDPSLPPKPKVSAQSAQASRNGSSKHSSSGNTSGGTHSSNSDAKRSPQGQQHNSASTRGGSSGTTHTRKRQTGSFFGSKKPLNNGAKRETFNKGFNVFLKAKEAHDAEDSMAPFLNEKPYFAAPTWTSTVEKSHKTLFPDIQTVFQESQARMQMRQMSAMGGMPPVNMGPNGMPQFPGAMMGAGVPGGPGGAPNSNGAAGATSPNPMMGGFQGAGGYMPFQPQPMFYPGMNPMGPMMGGKDGSVGPNGSTSPPPMPDQMGYMPPGAYMGMGDPYGYPMGGMPQFPGAMMGGPQGMMGNEHGGSHRGYQGHGGHGGHRGSRGSSKNSHGHRA